MSIGMRAQPCDAGYDGTDCEPVHGDPAVEVVRVPHLAELAVVPALVQVLEVEVAGRRDRVLAAVGAAAEVLAAAGRGRGDEDRLPVLEDGEHLRVEIDLDPVAFGLRLAAVNLKCSRPSFDRGRDPAVAREPEQLLDRGDRVARCPGRRRRRPCPDRSAVASAGAGTREHDRSAAAPAQTRRPEPRGAASALGWWMCGMVVLVVGGVVVVVGAVVRRWWRAPAASLPVPDDAEPSLRLDTATIAADGGAGRPRRPRSTSATRRAPRRAAQRSARDDASDSAVAVGSEAGFRS